MICDFCRVNILESKCGRNWDFHHRSPLELEISAVEGCVFCRRLAAHLQEPERSLPETWYRRVRPGDVAYRWSIRKAASTSELGECIIITFRALPSVLKEELKGTDIKEKVYTADQTFYLLPEKGTRHIPVLEPLRPVHKLCQVNQLIITALSFPPAPEELGNSTASAESWKQVNKWLNECESGHPECRRRHGSGEPFRPTRLLDIGTSDSPWPPKTVRMNCTDIEDPEAPHVESYVTLSHSWGLTRFARLLKGNLKEWTEKGVPWTEVCTNKNFVHAVEVTRRIGARYIWIDSLCIVQDNADDWHAEAPLMHDIYRNSHCNIAASDSSDARGGMFRSRSSHLIAPAQYTGVPGQSSVLLGGKTWRVVSASLWEDDLIGGPLYTRGWVFQERMLAPRILHYAGAQVFWDCATASACEALPAGLPPQLDATARVDRRWRGWLRAPVDAASMDVDDFWAAAVRTYTSNNLTKQSDKLVAIWGIAALVLEKQRQDWGAWGAGLWAARLEQQLAWTVTMSGSVRNPEFPTWSWASVVGTVELAQLWGPDPIYTVTGPDGQPISFDEIPEDSDDKARGIKSSEIKMRCHVGSGILGYHANDSRFVLEVEGANDDSPIQVLPDSPLDDGTSISFLLLLASRDHKKERTEDGQIIVTAFVEDDEDAEYAYSGFGLLISDGGKPDFFNRIGVIRFSEISQDHWDRVRHACGDYGDGKTTMLDPASSSSRLIHLE